MLAAMAAREAILRRLDSPLLAADSAPTEPPAAAPVARAVAGGCMVTLLDPEPPDRALMGATGDRVADLAAVAAQEEPPRLPPVVAVTVATASRPR